MGRPVKRDVLGTEVFGTYIGAAGIIVSAYIYGSLRTDAYIISQRSSHRYKVYSPAAYAAAIGNGKTSAEATILATAVCRLGAIIPAADGQMLMIGYNGMTSVAIVKLTKRIATDSNENRYTWVLVNDSSVDYIELTPVT